MLLRFDMLPRRLAHLILGLIAAAMTPNADEHDSGIANISLIAIKPQVIAIAEPLLPSERPFTMARRGGHN